jgi:hypothetical protein
MVRRSRFRAILALPFAAILFLIGWGLSSAGSRKIDRKVTLKPAKQEADEIKFTVLQPDIEKVAV